MAFPGRSRNGSHPTCGAAAPAGMAGPGGGPCPLGVAGYAAGADDRDHHAKADGPLAAQRGTDGRAPQARDAARQLPLRHAPVPQQLAESAQKSRVVRQPVRRTAIMGMIACLPPSRVRARPALHHGNGIDVRHPGQAEEQITLRHLPAR